MQTAGLGAASLVPALIGLVLGSGFRLFPPAPLFEADFKAELRNTRIALETFTESRDCKCEAKLDDKVEQVVLLRVALKASVGIELGLGLAALAYCCCSKRGARRPVAAKASPAVVGTVVSSSSESEQVPESSRSTATPSPGVPKGVGKKGPSKGPSRPSDFRQALADIKGQ
jgi:hypothetical protein